MIDLWTLLIETGAGIEVANFWGGNFELKRGQKWYEKWGRNSMENGVRILRSGIETEGRNDMKNGDGNGMRDRGRKCMTNELGKE